MTPTTLDRRVSPRRDGSIAPRDLDQLAVLLKPAGADRGVLDCMRPPLGRPPSVPPGDRLSAASGSADFSIPRHDPNRVP